MSVRQAAISGVRWTTFGAAAQTVINIGQVSLLARLLAAEDFGLIAMASAVTALAQTFADMGVSNAIMYRQEVTRDQLSSLYWFSVMIGATLTLVLLAASPVAAEYYHEPRLLPILSWISLSFLLSSIGQQFRVVAQKNLRFSHLAIMELCANLTGLITAAVMAFEGYGVYALVGAWLANSMISMLLSVFWLGFGAWPRFHYRFGEIRSFIKFGMYLVWGDLAGAINLQVDVLLIGRLFGAEILGPYSLAKNLALRVMFLINPIVTKVAGPILAKQQNDLKVLRESYLGLIRIVCSINFPIYTALIVLAEPVVAILFGSRWSTGTVLPLQIMAAIGLVRSSINPVGLLLMTRGRADLSFKWNLVLLLFVPLTIWLSADQGFTFLMLALFTVQSILCLAAWYFLVYRLCGAGFFAYFKQLTIPFVCSCIAGAAVWFGRDVFAIPYDFAVAVVAEMASGLLLGGILYMMLSYILNRTWTSAMVALIKGR